MRQIDGLFVASVSFNACRQVVYNSTKGVDYIKQRTPSRFFYFVKYFVINALHCFYALICRKYWKYMRQKNKDAFFFCFIAF